MVMTLDIRVIYTYWTEGKMRGGEEMRNRGKDEGMKGFTAVL